MRVKIVGIPQAKDGGTVKKDMFQKTLMFPNLISTKTNGVLKSETLGTTDEKIATSIGPAERENSNIEAERGEILVRPELRGMYKVRGKTHADGGTPIATPPGSFIFSNSKDLAFTDKDKKLFKFEKGGSTKKDNTPAKVLAREVDTKEYNRLIAIMEDPKKDNISKTSAALMIEKLQKKIGEVALLQESKKAFANGIPPFAQQPDQTDDKLSQDIVEDQYMKMGGLTQMGPGGYAFMDPPIDKYPGGKTKKGRTTPTGQTNEYNRDLPDYIKQWNQVGMNFNTKTPNSDVQGQVYDWLLKYNPDAIRGMWKQFGNTAKGIKDVTADKTFTDDYLKDPANLAALKNAYVDGMFGKRQLYPGKTPIVTRDKPLGPPEPVAPGVPATTTPIEKAPGNKYEQLPWEGFKFDPNAAETLSIALPGLQAMTTPTFYDMLSQKYTPNVRLDRMDNSQELADIKETGNLQTQEAYSSAPTMGLASAMSAQARSGTLKGVRDSNAATGQANIQIGNQETMMNAQAKANDNLFNIQQIHQTYNNNILSTQRRNEMYNNGLSQVVNNGLAVKKNLDSLAYMATAAALPSLTTMKDKDGNEMIYTGKDGKKYTQLGVPIGFSDRRMPTFDPRFGGLDSFLTSQYATQVAGTELGASATQELKNAFASKDTDRIKNAAYAYKQIFGADGKGISAANNALSQMLLKMSGQ